MFILFLTVLYNNGMPDIQQLKLLGETLRRARKAKNLTLEEVEELSGVSKNYVWILEEAYQQGKRAPTVPTDEKLAALGKALGIPMLNLHAALGRIPANAGAAALVREKAATHENFELTEAQMNALITDLERYAEMRLQITAEQSQCQSQCSGKQSQKQKQSVT